MKYFVLYLLLINSVLAASANEHLLESTVNDSEVINKKLELSLFSEWGNSALQFSRQSSYNEQELFWLKNTAEHTIIKKVQFNRFYQNSYFSAEGGVINENLANYQNQYYFIQGSYHLLGNAKLNVKITAKVESYNFTQLPLAPVTSEKSSSDSLTPNSSIGIIGQYSLTPHWKVIGAFTSSARNNSATDNERLENNQHIALIGTTYAF